MSTTRQTIAVESRAIPQTMRAVAAYAYGTADVIEDVSLNVPSIGEDEVLLEVQAAGIERGTVHLLTGTPYLIRVMGFGLRRPKQPVLGLEVAGTVAAVGSAVTRFAVGDAAFGVGSGTFAEYAVAKEKKLSHLPAGVDAVDAAASVVSASTALQALTDVGHLKPGQSVLVIGASGGVGSFAVQMAVALGGKVTAVASAAKADAVRSLGADRVLDYATEDYLGGAPGYDLIVDAGGLNPIRRLRDALAPAGTLVIVGGEGGNRLTAGVERNARAAFLSLFSKRKLTAFLNREKHETTDQIAQMLVDGSVRPFISGRYPLSDAAQAVRDLEDGRVTGKAVVIVGSDAGR